MKRQPQIHLNSTVTISEVTQEKCEFLVFSKVQSKKLIENLSKDYFFLLVSFCAKGKLQGFRLLFPITFLRCHLLSNLLQNYFLYFQYDFVG